MLIWDLIKKKKCLKEKSSKIEKKIHFEFSAKIRIYIAIV